MDRVALITGGSSGIGAQTTRKLLAAGHRVAVVGRDADRLARFTAGLDAPDGVLAITGDATDYPAMAAAVDETVRRFGRLDCVIASAGFSSHDTIADADPDRLREMVLTNVLGPALLVKAALPALRDSRGRIVLLGSVAGFRNSPGNMYSVTKWAVTALAENTRQLVTGDGIGVTLIAPGPVDTPFFDHRPQGAPPLALRPENIADAVAWAIAQPEGVDVNTMVIRPVGLGG
ncbi:MULTISPECIES: SDR family oxidoreductase [unclassified Nocardia]|uniref:SDR family oxidoreductase n=1 Tax=unclassified Nocardia TaxID=2637762 RepID=UPI001CE40F63|nr:MULTISPECIES: SDR family oxidoreductase [unclassified Nocardia]